MSRLKASKNASATRARKQTSPGAVEAGSSESPAQGRNGEAGATHKAAAAHPATYGNGALAPVSHEAQLAEKIKELVRLAQEQGYLTYGDINDALPESLITPEDL